MRSFFTHAPFRLYLGLLLLAVCAAGLWRLRQKRKMV